MTTEIEALQAYLNRIAHKLFYDYRQIVPSDDILQEMNVFILEQAAANPAFLEQEPGYITRRAAWHARDWMDPRQRGTNYGAQREVFSLDFDQANDEQDNEKSSVLAVEPADLDLQLAVRDALAELSGLAAEIAELMLEGYKIGEAAEQLGISKQAANYHRKAIAQALAPVYAAL